MLRDVYQRFLSVSSYNTFNIELEKTLYLSQQYNKSWLLLSLKTYIFFGKLSIEVGQWYNIIWGYFFCLWWCCIHNCVWYVIKVWLKAKVGKFSLQRRHSVYTAGRQECSLFSFIQMKIELSLSAIQWNNNIISLKQEVDIFLILQWYNTCLF